MNFRTALWILSLLAESNFLPPFLIFMLLSYLLYLNMYIIDMRVVVILIIFHKMLNHGRFAH